MEAIGRRHLLHMLLAGGAIAATTTLTRPVEAAVTSGEFGGPVSQEALEKLAASLEQTTESMVEPTQGVVVRGGRRGPRVIVRPGRPRRRRWRWICRRRRNGRLVCRRRWWW
jgi:hypothetical protein